MGFVKFAARSGIVTAVSAAAMLGGVAVPAAAALPTLFQLRYARFQCHRSGPRRHLLRHGHRRWGHGGAAPRPHCRRRGSAVTARIPTTPGEALGVQVGGGGATALSTLGGAGGGSGGGGGRQLGALGSDRRSAGREETTFSFRQRTAPARARRSRRVRWC
jgi:hypothetical protein